MHVTNSFRVHDVGCDTLMVGCRTACSILHNVCFMNTYCCQILMSVQQALICAINMPHVWILMEVTPAHATLDTLEMDKSAVVSISLTF